MILELDCGNRRLKWRLLDGEKRADGGAEMLPQAVGVLEALAEAPIDRVRMVSVASAKDSERLVKTARRLWNAPVSRAEVAALADGLRCAYNDPAKLGADRWLAMLAARRAAGGGAVMVIDAGTSLTVDFVAADGRHLGGYIAPGYHLLTRSLRDAAAGVAAAPPPPEELAPGRDTEQALGRGAVLMAVGLATEARRAAARVAPEIETATLFLTGGDAECLRPRMPEALHRPELVLDGLALVVP